MTLPARRIAFAHWTIVLLLQVCSVQTSNILIGFIYFHTPTSWVQESFAQFKLAVMDVNADASLLPHHNLTYIVADSQEDELVGLHRCWELVNAGVHIFVGPGHSTALGAPAMCASSHKIPMVSPGSDRSSLIDKSRYPFLFRTLASEASFVGATAVFIYEMGWRSAASLTFSTRELDAIQILQPALKALGIDTLTLFYSTTDTVQGRQELNSTLSLLSQSGYHIIILNARTLDAETIYQGSLQKGLVGWNHCWLMQRTSWEGSWTTAINVLAVTSKVPLGNPVRDAFLERWPTVSTRYNESIHGAWDPNTKMPFFGNNTYSNVVFDTDYAPVGDGLPDYWGMFAYDTVWVVAKVFHAILEAGHSVDNGTAVREALLEVEHLGVTGRKAYSRGTQDGAIDLDFIMTNGSAMHVTVASTTSALSSGVPGDGSWCLSGCLDRNLSQAELPWGGDGPPSDGRALDPERSEGVVGVHFQEGNRIDVIVSVRDSFGRPCCIDTCRNNPSSSICEVCRSELAAYDELRLVALNATQHAVEPLEPLEVSVDESAGRIVITVRTGFAGSTSEDRDLWLELRHRGAAIGFGGEAAKQIRLESRACQIGSAGADTACTQCLPGSLAPVRGMQRCQNCTSGRYQDLVGQSACKDCPRGFFSGGEGGSVCTACAPGLFQPLEGQESCYSCPEPMTTVGSGSLDVQSCVCPEGTYLQRVKGTCAQCPEGMECRVGSDESAFSDPVKTAPQVLPGFWSDPSEPLSIFRCLHGAQQCPGGSPKSCGEFLSDRVCVVCQDDYYESSGECRRCPSTTFSTILFPVVPAVLSMTVVYPVHLMVGAIHNDEAWNKPQKSLQQLFSICLAEFQIAGILLTCNLNTGSGKGWGWVAEPLGLLMPACAGFRTFESQVLTRLILPAWCAAAFLIAALQSQVVGRLWRQAHTDMDTLFGRFGTVFMAFYITVCGISMEMFKCYRHPNGTYSLKTAPNVLCYESGQWTTMVVFGIVAIFLYCICSVVLFTYKLREAPLRTWDDVFCKRWHFLICKFRAKERWWVIVWLLKGILLNVTQVVTSDGQNQLILLQLILSVYLSMTLFYRPWRHEDANYFDALAHLIPLLVCSLLFEYTPRGQSWAGRFTTVSVLLAVPVFLAFFFAVLRLHARLCLQEDSPATPGSDIDDDMVGIRSSRSSRMGGRRSIAADLKTIFMRFGHLADSEATTILQQLPEQDRRTLLSILLLVSDVQRLEEVRRAKSPKVSGSESVSSLPEFRELSSKQDGFIRNGYTVSV